LAKKIDAYRYADGVDVVATSPAGRRPLDRRRVIIRLAGAVDVLRSGPRNFATALAICRSSWRQIHRQMTNMLDRLLYRGPSWTELHEVCAKRHHIDDRAPIQSSNSIDIRAEVGKVWELISDVTAWPTFNPLIGKAHLYSPMAVDSAVS
jgi:hypothetical protein